MWSAEQSITAFRNKFYFYFKDIPSIVAKLPYHALIKTAAREGFSFLWTRQNCDSSEESTTSLLLKLHATSACWWICWHFLLDCWKFSSPSQFCRANAFLRAHLHNDILRCLHRKGERQLVAGCRAGGERDTCWDDNRDKNTGFSGMTLHTIESWGDPLQNVTHLFGSPLASRKASRAFCIQVSSI